MRARRTASSNHVYRLAGASEDHDLHVRIGKADPGLDPRDPSASAPYIASVWEPEPGERAAIGAGANIELVIYGNAQPPVSVAITREQPLSRPRQAALDDPGVARIWLELTFNAVTDLLDLLAGRASRASFAEPAQERMLELERLLVAGVEALKAPQEPTP